MISPLQSAGGKITVICNTFAELGTIPQISILVHTDLGIDADFTNPFIYISMVPVAEQWHGNMSIKFRLHTFVKKIYIYIDIYHIYTVTLNTYITAVNTVHYHNGNLSTTFELGVLYQTWTGLFNAI